MKSVLINLSLFKAAWAATVFGAAASVPVAGAVAVAIAVLVHLARTRDVRAEATLLVLAAVVGLVWETLLVATGVLEYSSGNLVPGVAPYWIVAMWILFATTLNVGMRWLRKSTILAAAAGAIGGPASFFAGASAGAVTLSNPLTSLVIIAAGWAVLLPLMVRIASRFDGHDAQQPLVAAD